MNRTRTTTSPNRRPRRAAVAGLALAAAAATALAGLSPGAGDELALAAKRSDRPNVVVVMTDDQDARSVRVMRNVKRQLMNRGTTFENNYATFPLCCPSRVSFLTGQYAHNHGVLGNRPPEGGFEAFDDRKSLPVALGRAGYRTGFVGKYLNQYGARQNDSLRTIPRGWDQWFAAVEGTATMMYDYRLNENGRLRRYGDRPRDYQTDVLAGKAESFIRRSVRRGEHFFLTVSMSAPHREAGHDAARSRGERNPRPAPRHHDRFKDASLPPVPSFNEADVSDKPSFVQSKPPLGQPAIRLLNRRHQDRLASLLAVDDAVGRIVTTLRRTGELNDTVVIFTSDNGYLEGVHRLRAKNFLYEESARVPFVISGPGIARGKTRSQITANIDLAPTILDLAGADPLRPVDGRSVVRMTRKPSLGAGRSILLENASSTAVRTPEYMYAEHPGGETELYDMVADPFQLDSLHADPLLAPIRERLAERLDELRRCAEKECR